MTSFIRNLAGSLTTPGSSLQGRDKNAFESFRNVIDRCTHELLIRPDWAANLECVDLANSERSKEVLTEVVLLLRRKLGSKTPRVVLMTLHLLETLVKNGTSVVHGAIGNDYFMKEMANIARSYNSKQGSENREVTTLCLDVIQTWGEYFMPRRAQFPAYSKCYLDLRREGLPFNTQFDPTKLTDFSPPTDSGGGSHEGGPSDDEALAAALAASFAGLDPYEDDSRATGSRSNSQEAYRGPQSQTSFIDLVSAVNSSVSLMQEMVAASTGPSDLRDNDVARQVSEQLEGYQESLVNAIDSAVVSQPEVVESLFKAHSDVQTVLQVYRDMQGGGGPSNGSGYSSGSSMPTLPVSARMVPTTSSYGPSYGQSARINTGPAPLLDLDEDVGNPLLLAASSKQTAQKASSVPAPGRPTSQPRSTVPAPIAAPRQAHTVPIAASPNPAPATLTATADLLGDPFAPVPAPAQRPQYDPFADPFGGSSSIDSLLGPANATTNNAPSSQPARSHPVDPFL